MSEAFRQVNGKISNKYNLNQLVIIRENLFKSALSRAVTRDHLPDRQKSDRYGHSSVHTMAMASTISGSPFPMRRRMMDDDRTRCHMRMHKRRRRRYDRRNRNNRTGIGNDRRRRRNDRHANIDRPVRVSCIGRCRQENRAGSRTQHTDTPQNFHAFHLTPPFTVIIFHEKH